MVAQPIPASANMAFIKRVELLAPMKQATKKAVVSMTIPA